MKKIAHPQAGKTRAKRSAEDDLRGDDQKLRRLRLDKARQMQDRPAISGPMISAAGTRSICPSR